MINKELFEGPVGDFCIARNTIKCLFSFDTHATAIHMLSGAVLCGLKPINVIVVAYHNMC